MFGSSIWFENQRSSIRDAAVQNKDGWSDHIYINMYIYINMHIYTNVHT